MLGTKTKQVFSYGRRGHRIVAVSEDNSARLREEAGTTTTVEATAVDDARSLRDKTVSQQHADSTTVKAAKGSTYSERAPHRSQPFNPSEVVHKEKAVPVTASGPQKVLKPTSTAAPRKPLNPVSANVLSGAHAPKASSASLAGQKQSKPRKVSGRGTPMKPFVSLKPISPVVDVEIMVLDGSGKQLDVEKRTTKPAAKANPAGKKVVAQMKKKEKEIYQGTSTSTPIVLSDSDDDDYQPRVQVPRRAAPTRRRAVIVSDSSDSDIEIIAPPTDPSTADRPRDSRPVRPPSPTKRDKNVIRAASPISTESVASGSRGGVHVPSAKPTSKSAEPIRTPIQADVPKPPPAAQAKKPVSRSSIKPPPLAHPSRPPAEDASTGRLKPRPLTPIRSRAGFPAPPSPPSPTTPSELDESLSFDFGELALSPKTLRGLGLDSQKPLDWDKPAPKQPAYLRPLLEHCGQSTPHEFSAFIEMFPFDQIVQTSHDGVHIAEDGDGPRTRAAFRKIGEASYSEVFGIGDVVLKIIPLRNEEAPKGGKRVVDDAECPAPSDAKDVLKEIIVTEAMGGMCDGFVELLRTYVVRGKYPSLLLDLWDEYNERKGSESVRPDGFSVSQVYAIIVLPNGGPDLESYTFPTGSKTGWRQACSIFWQVTRALAQAEELVRFEHRDLHWGQILVKAVAPPASAARRAKKKAPMDADVHGVRATIIDLGLARMQAGAAGVDWTPFDAETFEGEGDYQFDVYRMMRAHNGDAWEAYRPLTNVMWLHYLADKLLHAKRLRKPIAPKSKNNAQAAPAPTFSELECYESLVEVEAILAAAVDKVRRATKKGRRKTQAVAKPLADSPESASDVLDVAYDRGWLRD